MLDTVAVKSRQKYTLTYMSKSFVLSLNYFIHVVIHVGAHVLVSVFQGNRLFSAVWYDIYFLHFTEKVSREKE